MTTRTRVTAATGLATTLVAACLEIAVLPHWLRLVGALMFACVSLGCAVMCWIDTGEPVAQASLILVTSLALFSLGSAVMIWSAAWHPMTAFLIFAVVSVISCAARLRLGLKA